MIAAANDPPPLSRGRRGKARLRLDLPAKLHLVGDNCDCILHDLSQTGARILAECAPAPPGFGMLDCDPLRIYFFVEWRDGHEAGLRFDEMVGEATLLRLREIKDNLPALVRRTHRELAREWVEGLID